jgi:signal transduction histidine kinase
MSLKLLFSRLIATLCLFLLALLAGELLLARWAVGLDDAGVSRQLWTGLACFGGALTALGIVSVLLLRPLYAGSLAPQLLRSTLRFPALFSLAGLAALLTAGVVKLLIDVSTNELPFSTALGLGGATLTIGLLLVALGFILARSWTYPLIAALAREQLPPGLRLAVSWKVAFALLAVALATTLPPLVTYFGRTQQQGEAGARRNAQQLADVLSHGARHASPEAHAEAMASVPASVAAVSVTARPGPTAAKLPNGQWLRLALPRRQYGRAGFIAPLLIGVVGLALLLGVDLGRSIGRDVRLVTDRISTLLDRPEQGEGRGVPEGSPPAAPLLPEAPQLLELQALAGGVNQLLARIAEINVGNFVAVERILEIDQVKTQFLANMSHDLKSPLNSILGFAELLERGMEGELEPGQLDAVRTIHRNATELLHLIVEVLDAAKVEAGRMALHREDVLPTQVVTEAIRRLGDRSIPPDVTIDTELQAGLAPVSLDTSRIAEALVYVLRFSAHEAGAAGSITLRVALQRSEAEGERRAERWLRIAIEDSSPGVDEARLPTLFDGFRRQPGHKGLGLGLPLARAFVELHGGSLELEPREDGGNLFVVLLPARRQKAAGRLRPVKV